jgi:DNA-binding MarR family transcriptional regulator
MSTKKRGFMKNYPLDEILDDIYREKNRLISSFLEKYSLGNGQFQILNVVAWNDGISQEGIASLRNKDKSAVAKSVRGLIEKGYIVREKNEIDKRAYCLHCTPKGRHMIPEIQKIVEKVDTILLKDFSSNEQSDLKNFCYRIQSNIASLVEDE